MKTPWTILVLVAGPLLALLLVFAGIIFTNNPNYTEFDMNIFDFESCSAAGYPIMESFPRQCRTDDGRVFVENIYPNA